MKFSTRTRSFLLVVSCTTCSEVTAFSVPQQSSSKPETEFQFLHRPSTTGAIRGHQGQTKTKLFYAPKRQQDEESKTKLHYVSKRTKKDDSTDLYYAPSTTPEYETPFVIDKFITSSGKIINPFRESDDSHHQQKQTDHVQEEESEHTHQHHNKGAPFYFANIMSSVGKKSDQGAVLDMAPNVNVQQNTKDDEIVYSTEMREQNAYSDLPSALGYATSLSVACMASGMTKAANFLVPVLEESAKVSQHIETSFAEMAYEIKQKDSFQSQGTTIGERIRHGSKHSPGSGSGSGSANSMPELVQSLIDQADKVVSSSSELWNNHMKKKIASVPPPADGKKYYSPFEACNILYQHEMDQGLDKPKAMKIMLDNKYVPVGRSQLYKVFRQFKDGKITEEKRWGQRGRPSKVLM